ncbi:uroporphyrinogen decarboxylase [Amnibacterium sp.]|uniref:uroporphyrinogen decarboxylase n=1 Tax=Amnibacterium sp. TaxID=1872496 RepID=UPI002603D7FE|nr:uroporphyrinogen decarboxylase [Amnibacterium sp.]
MPPLLAAYAGRRQATPPVWFMRQAGRSLPEYRASRARTAMLDACLEPELAAEITVQPVRRHGVDAAILFSDIVVPLKLAGVDVDIVPGRGPVFARPVRTPADLDHLVAHELHPEALAPIEAAVARTVERLGATPLIGFAGAPFTLASYVVEGGPSKDQLRARTLLHADPVAWGRLTAWLAGVSGAFLAAQVRAGARAVQLFDSWAGALSEGDYRAAVLPASARALAAVPGGVPKVHFGTGTALLLPAMRDAGADVIGVDHRLPLDAASALLEHRVPLQGNVDPALLAAPWPVLERHLEQVVTAGAAAPAHVLNLGHGVPPTTDPGVLTRIVDWMHSRV